MANEDTKEVHFLFYHLHDPLSILLFCVPRVTLYGEREVSEGGGTEEVDNKERERGLIVVALPRLHNAFRIPHVPAV